jgi:hypothetical protein
MILSDQNAENPLRQQPGKGENKRHNATGNGAKPPEGNET